jgi:hypothetical protein
MKFESQIQKHKNHQSNFLRFFFITVLTGCSNMYECGHFRHFLNHEAYGTVTEKLTYTANHMRPIIRYKTVSGKPGIDDQIGTWLPDAYDSIKIGDEISKTSGTTFLILTRDGREIKFDTTSSTRENWCHQ